MCGESLSGRSRQLTTAASSDLSDGSGTFTSHFVYACVYVHSFAEKWHEALSTYVSYPGTSEAIHSVYGEESGTSL